MRILRISGIVLLVLVSVMLVAGLFMEKKHRFEGSAEIRASSDRVWSCISYLKNRDLWSQWRLKDPAMKVVYSGTDGQTGASMRWTSSHEEVGNGSETIVSVVQGKRIDTELSFDGYGKALSFMELEGDSAGCRVVWGLEFESPYPFNALSPFFMDRSEMDKMFSDGFVLLKQLTEQGPGQL